MVKKVIGWLLFLLAMGNVVWWILFPGDFKVFTAVITVVFFFGWYRLALKK